MIEYLESARMLTTHDFGYGVGSNEEKYPFILVGYEIEFLKELLHPSKLLVGFKQKTKIKPASG